MYLLWILSLQLATFRVRNNKVFCNSMGVPRSPPGTREAIQYCAKGKGNPSSAPPHLPG